MPELAPPLPRSALRPLLAGALLPLLAAAAGCEAGAPAPAGSGDAPGPTASSEPDPREAEVIAVAEDFLRALSARDGAWLDRLALPGGSVHAVGLEPGGALRGIWSRPFEDDVASLPTNPNALYERMWEPVALVHERIAMVWTPYDFWVNGAWSHCGIDIFTLIETEDGWRISSITYTVEMEGCPDPPLPPPTREELGVDPEEGGGEGA
jgi:hypothetical protein